MKLRKKLNNKGFSLVELLAVLVILITILTIAIPSITSSVERNKENMLKKKYDLIEAAAESYVNQYKNSINYTNFISGSCGIDIGKIKSVGLLTDDDLKDANDNSITVGSVWYVDENSDNVKEYVFKTVTGGC